MPIARSRRPEASVRERLLDAAEDLIADRGTDEVSLREVTAAASARNASAVQYHFGDRAGLLQALIARHRPAVEARRHELLDGLAAGAGLGDLADALVRPLAERRSVPGGAGYLQLLSDLANRPRPAIDPASLEDPSDSLYRWRAEVGPRLPPGAVVLHRRFVAIRFALTELARRGRSGSTSLDDELFERDLIDQVTGLLDAPVSAATANALDRRERGRSPRS